MDVDNHDLVHPQDLAQAGHGVVCRIIGDHEFARFVLGLPVVHLGLEAQNLTGERHEPSTEHSAKLLRTGSHVGCPVLKNSIFATIEKNAKTKTPHICINA
jgi:hypothetical protein